MKIAEKRGSCFINRKERLLTAITLPELKSHRVDFIVLAGFYGDARGFDRGPS